MIKKLRVTVDGKPYEVSVEVEDESGAPPASAATHQQAPPPAAPAPVPPAPATHQEVPQAKPAAGAGDVTSPLAGRVISIAVKVGQEVKENEHLLTLEAMKMNTFVFSPGAGKVLEIKAAVGDAVAEGQLLARIG